MTAEINAMNDKNSISYDKLLKRMQAKYEEKSGFRPEAASDINLRLQVLAGELYALSTSLGWLRRQAFPQTALGEELSLHAEQRGLSRITAQKAQGKLLFSRSTPLSYDVLIPKRTVCASVEDEAVEYETTEDVVLKAGELSVSAEAEAAIGGERGNAAAERITTLVTPPIGIEAVTNPQSFVGGKDSETDEELRNRLMRAYSVLPNGTNAEFYRRLALEVEGVTSARVAPRKNGAGTVGVYIWGEGEPDPELVALVQEKLQKYREINVEVFVQAAEKRAINVSVYIKPMAGSTFAEAKEKAEEAIKAHFALKKIGDATFRNKIGAVLINLESVENYTLAANMTDFSGEAEKIHVLGSLNVMEMPL